MPQTPINDSMMKPDDQGGLFGEAAPAKETDILGESHSLYLAMVKGFHEICMKLKIEETVDCNPLRLHIESLISYLKKDERMLLGLANAPYSYVIRQAELPPEGMIAIHSANSAVYAMKIFLELAVPQNRMPYLGIASLCTHLGLLDAPQDLLLGLDSAPNAAKLLADFEEKSRKYVAKMRIDNFHMESIEALLSLVKEEQQALSKTSLNEAIHQYAMVIHICDIFETLTHQRGYGEIFAPVDAMKKMRDEMKDYFNQDIIKFFFNKLSIYPLGSFVKLSSEETAKIVGVNENFIMRPVIFIVLDPEGREKPEPVKINLRERPTLYIKKAIMDEFLCEKYISLF
ncbi:MAG: hypothetical protein A2X49_15290 [Lentisphaerae bacterium GWF2_52_8]|nr:MAG: hypothetical protein A2X49_15290 [Lentisphaerae bacterium GWF2_52_8]